MNLCTRMHTKVFESAAWVDFLVSHGNLEQSTPFGEWRKVTFTSEKAPNWVAEAITFLKQKTEVPKNLTTSQCFYKTMTDFVVCVCFGEFKFPGIESEVLHHNKKSLKELDAYLDTDLFSFDDWTTDIQKKGIEKLKGRLCFSHMNTLSDIRQCLKDFRDCHENTYDGILPYDHNLDIEKTKNGGVRKSEAAYNKRIAGGRDYFELKDRHLTAHNIEECDIYNSRDKHLLHIKKNGDLRILALQALTSYLYLSDEEFNPLLECGKRKYIDCVDDTKTVYLIVIVMKKLCPDWEDNIHFKDKIAIGITVRNLRDIKVSCKLVLVESMGANKVI